MWTDETRDEEPIYAILASAGPQPDQRQLCTSYLGVESASRRFRQLGYRDIQVSRLETVPRHATPSESATGNLERLRQMAG